MSTIKVDTLLAADGTTTTAVSIPALDTRFCTAWVNFDGTGTVAIRDSYNVASITDIGAGDYTANFAVAMADVNYSATCSAGRAAAGSGNNTGASIDNTGYLTTACEFFTTNNAGTPTDASIIAITVFGGQA